MPKRGKSRARTLPAAQKKMTRIRARNEKLILDAALEEFATRGFHGATVDRISERARISKPNLHYYFKTKQALYVAVLKRTLDVWLRPLHKLDPDGDPAQELSAYIVAKVAMSEEYPLASRVYANEMLNGAPFLETYLTTELRDIVERKGSAIKRWIARGKIIDIDPMHLLFLIWAYTQHFADFLPQVKAVLGLRKLGKGDFQHIADSLCTIVFQGILPRMPQQFSGREMAQGKRPAADPRRA